MHRVVTKYKDRNRNVVIEHGPWHPTRQEAQRWADLLAQSGYRVDIESRGAEEGGGTSNADLAQALASMA
ncbi:MAG: hypothetical protein JNM32_02755 [Dechloromonas sp.]|jgi:hypothetical protein|nr:hypothetical protein [Dechloromonas sp.]